MQNNVGIYASQISGHLYGGPYGSYDSLATVTVGSTSVASITFAGIPSGYKHLQLRIMNLSSAANGDIITRFNGDSTAANYSLHFLYASGASAASYGAANNGYVSVGLTGQSTNPAASVCDILDYSSTNKNKTVRSLCGVDQNGSGYVFYYSGAWLNSSSAISNIVLSHGGANTFAQYSQFALYGVK